MRHLLGLFILLLASIGTLCAQDAPKPSTVGNAEIEADRQAALDKEVDQLKLELRPLLADQLAAEVDGWLAMLRAKDQQVVDVQIDYREEKAKASPDAARLSELLAAKAEREREKTRLIDRTTTALRALRDKGGEIDKHEKYVAAISGLDVDVKDASAAWTAIINWLKSPEGGIRWALNIILFVVVLIGARIISSFLGRVTRKAVSRMSNTSDLLRDFFVNAVRKVTFLIGLIIALSMLGVDIGPLVAGLGVAGFVIGFALQGTLSNFASGLMILMYRPYDIGDFIAAAGVTGTVNAMTLVSTTLRTPDNQTVVIPNNSIWGGIITNVTGNATRRVDLTAGIGYSDDIEKAQKVLEEIVTSHPLVLAEPAPVIRLHELADSSVKFVIRPWSKTSDYWAVYWDLTRTIKERFDQEDISIPFPQRDVHIHQVASATT